MESILKYVRTNVGLTEDDNSYDTELISHTNDALAIVTHQLGVGPDSGFAISDEYAKWSDFLPTNEPKWNVVKEYVHMKVKRVFDPPSSAAHLASLERQIAEHEWRISIMV